MKSFLRNDDTADKPMLDLFSGDTSIVVPSTESQTSAIDLRFHHCTASLPGGSWQNIDNNKFESTAIHVLNVSSISIYANVTILIANTSIIIWQFSKPKDTASESEESQDFITFIVSRMIILESYLSGFILLIANRSL